MASRLPRFSVLGSWFWSKGAPLVLIVVTLLLCLLAYGPRFALSDQLTRSPTNIRISGTYPIEGLGAQAQRWTSTHATLRFAGVGAGGYALLLRFHGGAEAGKGRVLSISSGDAFVARVPVRGDWQELDVALPPTAVGASGDLVITLDITSIAGTPGDPRKLGVALQSVALRPTADQNSFLGRVPTWRAAQLACVLLLVFFCLRIVGVPVRGAFAASLTLGLAFAVGLATARMDTAQLLDLGMLIVPWMLVVALGLRVIPFGTGDRRPEPEDRQPQNWLRLRSSVLGPRSAAQALVCCAVLLIFTLRLGGLLHPQYINIDQGLRANQLVNIAAGRADLVRPQLEQQYEWGTREPVPYSLLTYWMLVPLTWLWHGNDLITATEATSVLLDATVPLLLWALLRQSAVGSRQSAGENQKAVSSRQSAEDARRETRDARRETASSLTTDYRAPITDDYSSLITHHSSLELAAGFAGLCYAALPVGYLFFHDGSFPTTIGVWFVLVALVSVRILVEYRGAICGPLSTAYCLLASAFLALALVAYVTHIAFVTFLMAALILSIWFVGGRRTTAIYLALALIGALLIDWLLYYRDYTTTLLERTIPAFVGQIVERGSVGHDTGLLYNTAVNSFGQHLEAHFRVWPVFLGGAALCILLLHQRNRFATHVGLAYALFFSATLLAERWFGLWNKHMYFAAPGVALLAGVGLAWLWQRGRAGQVLCVTLLVLLFWQSTLAWGNRALWYVLPASAL